MLSSGEYEALCLIRDTVVFYENGGLVSAERLRDLKGKGYIKLVLYSETGDADGWWGRKKAELLPAGLDAIEEFDNEREQRSADQARYEVEEITKKRWRREDVRRSWWQVTLNGIFLLLGIVIGAFLSSKTTLLDWLAELWKRFP